MNPYITIFTTSGEEICQAIITKEAKRIESLMGDDYVELSWNDVRGDALPVGAYIVVGGETYRLLDPYKPEQKSEIEWLYRPRFQSRVAAWSKVPFFMYTTNEAGVVISREPDWTLTDNAANFIAYIARAIKRETGEEWTAQAAADLAEYKTVQFSSADIFSALNAIASAFETEWLADKTTNTLTLGKATVGNAADKVLTVGANVTVPTVTDNAEGYFNRFYIFGSTRNITQEYQDASVNNLINKRLTLDPTIFPGGYIDVRTSEDEPVLSKTLIFDDIYPRSNLVVTDARPRLMYTVDSSSDSGDRVIVGTDSDGNPIYDTYAIWYVKLGVKDEDTGAVTPYLLPNTDTYSADTPEGVLIAGKTLSVHFSSGSLQGREFELAYHDTPESLNHSDGTPFEVEKGMFEIILTKEGDYVIPAVAYLIPSVGDKAILFNLRMPQEYVEGAYLSLKEAADKEIALRLSNRNNYEVRSNPIAFDEQNPALTIGRAVRLVGSDDFTLDTRVISLETQLDFACEQTITLGNAIIKGNTQTLKEEVADANRDINLLLSLNQVAQSTLDGYNRAISAMQEGFARIAKMWQFDPDRPDVIFTPYDAYSRKSLSALGHDAGDTEQAPGTGGIDEPALAKYLADHYYATKPWVEGKGYITADALAPYAKLSDIPSLAGYATEQWVLAKGYLTAVAWGDVTGKPSWIGATKPSYNFSEIGSKPTTLGGYGITDAKIAGGVITLGANSITPLVAADMKTLTLQSGTFTAKTYTPTSAQTVNIPTTSDHISEGTTNKFFTDARAQTALAPTITTINAAIATKLDKSVFDDLFEKVNLGTSSAPKWAIRAKYGFYSDDFVSALGADASSGASSGGGAGFGRLDDWSNYNSSNNDALSALLGYGLKTRIEALEGKNYLNDLAVVVTGSGNAITAATQSADKKTLTLTKGAIFLSSHQPIHTLTIQKNGVNVDTFTPNGSADKTINIADVASAATLSSHTSNGTVHITAAERTAWNTAATNLSAILGADSDTIINKWEEVVAFLDTYTEADTLASLLSNKADKTVQIKAGTGLTGGGTLATDRTLSLATSGVTAGSYNKVTVDAYGRVTAGSNPTTLAGHGIADAYTKTEADGKFVHIAQIGNSTDIAAIKTNGLLWSDTDGATATMTNAPFNNCFAMLTHTNYGVGDDMRRSRLAFNGYGQMKLFNDRGTAGDGGVWYDVLTSGNYAGMLDGRYVNAGGDTMTGHLVFNNISPTTYPADSVGLKWGGGTDGANIFYRLMGNDQGRLILNMIDDSNTEINFEWSGSSYGTANTAYRFQHNALLASEVAATFKSIKIGDCLITWDSTGLHFSKGIYSDEFVSALGADNTSQAGGSAGGGSGWGLLTKWTDYSSADKDAYALSAGLGKDLYDNKLSKTDAAATYLSKTDASATYLSKTDAAAAYQPLGKYVASKPDMQTASMNTAATYGNAMGMIYLNASSDGLINPPHSDTSWYHFINMSYNVTPTNMWQTQMAVKAGTTDLWIRSRNGGSVSDTAAWPAPWTRILTGTNYSVVLDSRYALASSLANYVTLNGAQTISGQKTLTDHLIIKGTDIRLGTVAATTDDSGDLVWLYGDNTEKARIYFNNEMTSAIGPNYRVYMKDGTLIYLGRLATTGELSNYLTTASAASTYVKKAGDTMTGALNFANFTANRVGDDVYIGDFNASGQLGIQGTNGDTGLAFLKKGETWGTSANRYTMTWDGTNMAASKTALFTNLNADLLDGLHYNSYVFTHDASHLASVNVALGYAAQTQATSTWNGNYILLQDISTWADSSTSTQQQACFSGQIWTFRPHGSAEHYMGTVVAKITKWDSGDCRNFTLETDTAAFTPCIITYDSKTWLAIKMVASYRGYVKLMGMMWSLKPSPFTTIEDIPSNAITVVESATVGRNIAYSATKLLNSRKLWGRPFDGTADVSGDMTGVGNITTSPGQSIFDFVHSSGEHGYLARWSNRFAIVSTNALWLSVHTSAEGKTTNPAIAINSDNNVGVLTSTPAYPLDVNGQIRACGWLRQTGNAGWYNETYGGGWFMQDANWIRSYNNKNVFSGQGIIRSDKLFDREGYVGASWNNGYGAYNVAISDNNSQTPLLLAYRAGADVTSPAGANRLFSLELLNNGGVLRFAFGGSSSIEMHNDGKLKIGQCEITWDGQAQMLKFSKGIYSSEGVSALGADNSTEGSGVGTNLLQEWSAYNSATAKQTALSAFLGNDLPRGWACLKEARLCR